MAAKRSLAYVEMEISVIKKQTRSNPAFVEKARSKIEDLLTKGYGHDRALGFAKAEKSWCKKETEEMELWTTVVSILEERQSRRS